MWVKINLNVVRIKKSVQKNGPSLIDITIVEHEIWMELATHGLHMGFTWNGPYNPRMQNRLKATIRSFSVPLHADQPMIKLLSNIQTFVSPKLHLYKHL